MTAMESVPFGMLNRCQKDTMQRTESGNASTAGESGCRQYNDVTLRNKRHPIVSHKPHTLL